jgi:hypothetical protein
LKPKKESRPTYYYLQGDLELSLKFPEHLQTLEEEIDNEVDDKDWAWSQELNYHGKKERYLASAYGDMVDPYWSALVCAGKY